MLRLLFLLILSSSVYAQVIGHVDKVIGSASVVDDSENVINNLIKGTDISSKARVYVAKKSFLRLKMADGSVLSLGANTLIDFEKYEVEKDSRRSLLNLLRGKVRAKIRQYDNRNIQNEKGEKTDVNLFTVRTKTAAVGVRGTQFLVNSYVVSNKPVTDALLLTGKVNTHVVGTSAFDMQPGGKDYSITNVSYRNCKS